jgi:uncharacterized membrane protein
MLSGSTAALFLQGEVFWPYFAGAAISVTGAIAARKEVLLAAGAGKLVSLGRLFYAMPIAVFAAEHFTETKTISQLVPKWIPGPVFWTYLVGVALAAAALSFVTRIYGRWSGMLLGLMFFLFVALMHIPAIVSDPKDRLAWVIALRDLSFSGGALAFAGTQTGESPAKWENGMIEASRIFIAVATLVFGVQQLLHPDVVPGIPLERQTPTWIPGRIFWAYLAGVFFLVAGGRLLVKRGARRAAMGLGIMVLALVVAVYLPIWGASLWSIQDGLNYFADTLMFAGAALLLAEALPKETNGHV